MPRLSKPHGSAPRILVVLLCATLATSGLVQVEPAPTDALFFAFAGCVALWPRSVTLRGFNMVAMAGACLFLFGNGVSMMTSEAYLHATRYLVITIYMFLMFVLFAGWIGKQGAESAWTMRRAFCFGALLVAGIGILARFHLMPNSERYFLGETALRIRSTFKDPNVFAPYVVAAAMLVIHDVLVQRRKVWNAAIYGVAFALAILYAFSRGAMLHFGVSLLAYSVALVTVVREREITRRLLVAGTCASVVAIAALTYALAAAGLGDFFSERMTLQSYDTERFKMQALALDVAYRNPLGIGPGEWSTRPEFANDPHSTCLRVMAENGFLGLIGWLVWLGGCMATCVRGTFRRTRYASLYACTGAILFGLFTEGFVIDTLHWRHLFFVASLPIGVRMAELRASTLAARELDEVPADPMETEFVLLDYEKALQPRGLDA